MEITSTENSGVIKTCVRGDQAGKWLGRATVAAVAIVPLIIFPGIDRPFSTPKTILIGAFVLLAGIFGVLSGRLNRPKLPVLFLVSLAAFVSAQMFSSFFGEFLSNKLLWLNASCIGWFFLVLSNRSNALHMAIAMILACAVIAFIALLQSFGLDPFSVFGLSTSWHDSPRMKVFGTLGNPNFVAAILVPGIFLSVSLGRIIKKRALFFCLGALIVLGVLATGSKAGVLGIISALLWLGMLKRLAVRRIILAGVLLTVVMVLFMQSRSLTTTMAGRFYIWKVSASHLLERPLSGHGPGAFEPKFIEWETQYWRDGKGVAEEKEFAGIQKHAHNDYLETIVESGFPGFIGFISLLLTFFLFTFRQAANGGELVAGASAGMMALASIAMIDFPFHRPAALFFAWTLIAIVFLESYNCRRTAKG